MKPRPVEALAPARIDLCGGTLDIWPLNLMFENAVTVNMAVTIMARAMITPRNDGRIEIAADDLRMKKSFPSLARMRHDHKLGLASRLAAEFLSGAQGATITTSGQAPAGSGLGGSSALNIALGAAMARYSGRSISKGRLLDMAKDVEAAHLGIPTGLQDYLAALHGGANVFSFPPGGVVRNKIPASVAARLERMILLFYSGAARSSGINNWRMFSQVIGKDKRTMALFGQISRCAQQAADSLMAGAMEGFAEAVNGEWAARKKLFGAISTPAIDKAIAAGKKAGAISARICGAGGGGCFFLVAGEADRERVVKAAAATGAKPLDYKIARHGVKTRIL